MAPIARDRAGIRLADYAVRQLAARGHRVELIDAKAVGLPMLDRMFKEYPQGEAPEAMAALAAKIRAAHGFVFVVGEYNWGVQPGLKNLTDHYLEEWFWRPAGIVSYSGGRLAGVRSSLVWHGSLAEMGMVVISSTVTVGNVAQALDPGGSPTGAGRGRSGEELSRASPPIWNGGPRPPPANVPSKPRRIRPPATPPRGTPRTRLAPPHPVAPAPAG